MRQWRPDLDYPAFSALPVRMISGADPAAKLAVHVSGRFTVDKPPLVCLAGFHRNMADFSDFLRVYRACASLDWPIVLVDLAGRGRSGFRKNADAYSTVGDAHDLANILRALGIAEAAFIGQGHGGQVVMALAAHHPALIAGAVLINSGPTTNPQGLVRTRINLTHLQSLQGVEDVEAAMVQILSTDYPELSPSRLPELAGRTQTVDAKGKSRGLFDPALVKFLERFSHDDAFEPQWQLFDALATTPLMLVRSTLTDRLDDTTFDEMAARRPDAPVLNIARQASPALLDSENDVAPIADFVAGLERSSALRR